MAIAAAAAVGALAAEAPLGVPEVPARGDGGSIPMPRGDDGGCNRGVEGGVGNGSGSGPANPCTKANTMAARGQSLR